MSWPHGVAAELSLIRLSAYSIARGHPVKAAAASRCPCGAALTGVRGYGMG